MPELLARIIDRTSGERPTVLLSFGSPYIERQTAGTQAFMLAWNQNPLAEEAAAAALAGAPITGTLPIALPPEHPVGRGVRLDATDRYVAQNRR